MYREKKPRTPAGSNTKQLPTARLAVHLLYACAAAELLPPLYQLAPHCGPSISLVHLRTQCTPISAWNALQSAPPEQHLPLTFTSHTTIGRCTLQLQHAELHTPRIMCTQLHILNHSCQHGCRRSSRSNSSCATFPAQQGNTACLTQLQVAGLDAKLSLAPASAAAWLQSAIPHIFERPVNHLTAAHGGQRGITAAHYVAALD
jgi:hypothetical protein